jgi:hypothetical protein
MAVANLSSGASIAQVTPRVTRGITQAMLNSPAAMVQPESNISRASIGQLKFPADLPKYYFSLGISSYNRVDAFKFTVNATDTIKLPLPKQLSDNDQVSYEQQELGQMTGALSGATQALGEGNISGAISSVMSGIGGLAGGSALKAFKGLTGLNATEGLQAAFGIAPNPYTTVLLKGPTYKKHEFTWTLSPRTSGESAAIKNIIIKLKNSMLVGTPTAGFFTPAKIFEPKFFTNENYLYKFKPCVLENMSVNYTPSGAPAFYTTTGAPDAVELRLSFLEVEFWFAGQY